MRAAALLVAALAPTVLAHTWVEQLRNINTNGQYVGDFGYPRNYVAKTDPGYTGDSMNYLLPPLPQQPPFINSTNLLCHENQRKQVQNDKWPRLQTKAGDFVALRYMENGHITLPQQQVGKPDGGGTVYIFGTTNPADDEKIADVLQWTADGQGGNKRGILVAANNYDDGRCYENDINSPIAQARMKATPNAAMGQASSGAGGYPLFCESNVQVPKNAKTGEPYTLYWVWQWPTKPNTGVYTKGKDEYYTTCMDIDIVDAVAEDTGAQAKFPLLQQDGMSKAVSNFASRTARVNDPIGGELGTVFKNIAKSTSGASGVPTTLQSRLATATNVPSLTQRPGSSSSAAPNPGQNNGIVTITVTKQITVTAPAVTQIIGARATHIARNGAKFRGL